VLWTSLRRLKAKGFHFRRQSPIVPYIADFICKRSNLVIELDGSQHGTAERIAHDDKRTAYLNALGYRVLRFENDDVFENLHGVTAAIVRAAAPPVPLRGTTSPAGGGETGVLDP